MFLIEEARTARTCFVLFLLLLLACPLSKLKYQALSALYSELLQQETDQANEFEVNEYVSPYLSICPFSIKNARPLLP